MRYTLAGAMRGSVLAGGMLFGLAAPDFAAAYAGGGIPWETYPLPDGDIPWETRPHLSIEPGRLLPKVSTLGSGLEYRHAFSSRAGLRLESFNYHEARGEVNDLLRTELRLKLRTSSILFDWFPFQSRFRATAGIYVNRSELTGSANYDMLHFEGAHFTAQEINERAQELARTLRAAGYGDYASEVDRFADGNDQSLTLEARAVSLREFAAVSGRVRWSPYAPYFGIGWANAEIVERGFFYSFDIGVLYLGQPRVEYSLAGMLVDGMRPHYGPEFEAWIAAEEREAEARLGEFRYFPVISLGLGYSF